MNNPTPSRKLFILPVSALIAILGVMLLLTALSPDIYAASSNNSAAPQEGNQLRSTSSATSLKPYLLKDINPTQNSGYPNGSDPQKFTAVGDSLFFVAEDTTHGEELWKTDGTPEGTTLVRDIRTGTSSSYPDGLAAFDGKLFFRANDGINGAELWVSDGTYTGTRMVRNLHYGDANPGRLTEYNGELYFTARSGLGYELWKTDGTFTNTLLVRDIYTGSNSSGPYGLIDGESALYFQADDGVHGDELWKSDGTAAGTVLVKDINPAGDSDLDHFVEFWDKIYFSADNGTDGTELWVSDGTPEGTQIVKNINPDGGSNPQMLTDIGNSIYFFANDGTHGKELWVSDGTTDGTHMVKDINPSGSIWTSNLTAIVSVGDDVFFNIDDDTNGWELWRTDGTMTGTQMVKDINPGANCDSLGTPGEGTDICASYPRDMIAVNQGLYFSATDPDEKLELFLSDGTMTGTHRVTSTFNDENNDIQGVYDGKALVGNLLFLVIEDVNYGKEIWALDIRPDLVITKTVYPTTTLAPGDAITYTLEYQNQGGSSTWNVASAIMLMDIIPSAVTNPAYEFSGATIAVGSPTKYIWNVEELSPFEGGIITITGTISPDLTSTTTFSNTAMITSFFTEDITTTNNGSAVWTTVQISDYKVFIPLVLR